MISPLVRRLALTYHVLRHVDILRAASHDGDPGRNGSSSNGGHKGDEAEDGSEVGLHFERSGCCVGGDVCAEDDVMWIYKRREADEMANSAVGR